MSSSKEYHTDNPSFLLSAIFDRKREIMEPNPNANLDPFFLLKECAELSNLRSQTAALGGPINMKQEMAMTNYTNLCLSIAEKNPTLIQTGYDP